MRHAFSLVELSIVLVILGLLVGGVLSGQSLIRASELRKFTTDANAYITAIRSFQDRYNALPGDMANATAFWGQTDPNIAVCRVTIGSGTNTCNGDGDGLMETWEMFYAWKHLVNAGLIPGQYAGVNVPGGHSSIHHEVGVNCPRGINNGCWGLAGFAAPLAPGNSFQWEGEYGRVYFKFGKPGTADPVEEVVTPEEAYLIDIKMDDSKPGTGKLVTRPITNLAIPLGNCTDNNNTTTGTTIANYNLAYKPLACSLMLRQIM